VHAVGQLLLRESSRLVTLTGPGGVGKTRLALQVAADQASHFTDGIWFVSLAPISDPNLVILAISQALCLREARNQSPLEQVKSALQEKKVLLLLDNFEQVVSAAMLVADLLAGCPRLKVLVTSREVLHVRAELEFTVPPLQLPDPKHLPDLEALSQFEAVALFLERSQAVKPDFHLTPTNTRVIAEICMRLDGLPLAIVLAAARSKLFSPQALLLRLRQRLPLLTSSTRDMPARQQTLRNTIEWSYHLLTADEQRLFRHLSIFVGGCTLEAAESVSAALEDAMPPVLERVASLLDKNLLLQTDQEGEEPRLTMLETIREYGLECLTTEREREMTQEAHAAYYLQLAETATVELIGPQQAVWYQRLEDDHDNLRAAMQYLLEREEGERALRLCNALYWFWASHSHQIEGRTFFERTLARCAGITKAERAKALCLVGHLAYGMGGTTLIGLRSFAGKAWRSSRRSETGKGREKRAFILGTSLLVSISLR
jgi:predicted ATPase